MTQRERDVLHFAVLWRQAKFQVEEALLHSQLLHAIDMLIRDNRNEKAIGANTKKEPDARPNKG